MKKVFENSVFCYLSSSFLHIAWPIFFIVLIDSSFKDLSEKVYMWHTLRSGFWDSCLLKHGLFTVRYIAKIIGGLIPTFMLSLFHKNLEYVPRYSSKCQWKSFKVICLLTPTKRHFQVHFHTHVHTNFRLLLQLNTFLWYMCNLYIYIL